MRGIRKQDFLILIRLPDCGFEPQLSQTIEYKIGIC